MTGIVPDSLVGVMGVHEVIVNGATVHRGTYADCVLVRDALLQALRDASHIRPWFDTSNWEAMTEQIVSARKHSVRTVRHAA